MSIKNILKLLLLTYSVLIIGLNLRTGVIYFRDSRSLFQLGGDSGRFTLAAQKLIADRQVPSKSWLYIAYVVFIATGYFLGIGNTGIAIVQVLLGLFSLLALYQSSVAVFKSKPAALVSV